MSDPGPYTGKLVMFTHEGTAMVLAPLPPGFVATGAHVTTEPLFAACRSEPLLAQPDGLAVGRAEVDPWARPQAAADRLASRDLNAEAEAASAASPQVAWLRQARAVIDLLASPEPPEELVKAIWCARPADADWLTAGQAAWAWLRRQAGLEGGGR